MFEKLFAFLWRLYPRKFRQEYGSDALQLFRDCVRDETGFLSRLRLWFDLLLDFAVSIPHEYRLACAASTPSTAVAGDTPTFLQLRSGSPRFSSLFVGAFFSLLTMAFLVPQMSHIGDVQRSVAWTRAFNRFSESYWRGSSLDSPKSAVVVRASDNDAPKLDASRRHQIVLAAAESLRQHYFDPAIAERTADAILVHERNGDDEEATNTSDFAKLLTAQMRDSADDHDLEMLYSERPIPERASGPQPALPAAYREHLQRINCAFERVEVLPGNIGYIKLNEFPDTSACETNAREVMVRMNNAAAVVVDLRDNQGGFSSMVKLLSACFFDHPEYLYSPIENTTRESWTHSPVPGVRLADKPLYVLTSSRTISAAEDFAYNLKMLKRATLVGENTAGAAHAANFHALGNNFYLGTVDVKSINPYSKYDWNGTGVEADVKVNAADALNAALTLARSKRAK